MTDTTSQPRGQRFAPDQPLLILHPPGDVVALITDARATVMVRWTPEAGWTCSCPARTSSCGHVQAARRVIVLDYEPDDTHAPSAVPTA
ncbi:MAG: hypothetical protein ACR2KJ_11195 [Jatrophihabitans sp.]